MNLPIKELESVVHNCTEDIYYFTEKMLSEGIFIKYNISENPEAELGERGCMDSYLEIGSLNEVEGIVLGAEYYILYWSELLTPIQLYRMVKDVCELYSNHSKNEFVEIIRELSTQYRSSNIQSDLDHSESIISEIVDEIELIKGLQSYA